MVDAYSEVLLGYYISDNEDYIAQYHAFRMAIQTSRYKPYEIVCDNQGGHKKNAALGLFSKISVSTARQLRIMANLRRLRTFSTASRARY